MSLDRLRPNEREVLYAPDRRMNAYYYSFDPTGQPAIDAILSAVAHAGKGYHHTESWHDDGEWSRWGEGRSVVDVIQAAANEAALALLDAAEESDALRAERDALLAIIDDARHALSADGPKVEPARQVLARALPQITAWRDRTRHARDNTPPHVIAHRGAQLDAVTAERDALAEKVEDLECVLAGAGFCVECYANGRHKLDCSRRRTASALDGEASHE